MDIKTVCAFLIAGASIINLFVGFYLLYIQIEKVEALLHDVKFVHENKRFFGSSLFGRQGRLNAISLVVMMPNRLQRRGDISREACLRLPASFKFQVWTFFSIAYSCCFGMAGYYFFLK